MCRNDGLGKALLKDFEEVFPGLLNIVFSDGEEEK